MSLPCGCADHSTDPFATPRQPEDQDFGTAIDNRRSFESNGVLAINLMGAAGSGKTGLLEATARAVGGDRRLSLISGAPTTRRDQERMRAAGIPMSTEHHVSPCHLDAEMVQRALRKSPWQDADFLFIENVGNLICPAQYDLGQSVNVVALSVTQGEDEPLRYPGIFRSADLVLLTKIDLLPHLPGYCIGEVEAALARLMPKPQLLPLSASSGQGMSCWFAWLDDCAHQQARPRLQRNGLAAAI